MSNNILKTIKVSVIVPTYKPGDYLWECLDSIVNQSLQKDFYEVIIILNGCCEPWLGNIDSYILKKTAEVNIKLINCYQSGVSNARNIGLDVAKGEFITFIDDDDYISPNYLEDLLSIASPDTVSCSNTYSFYDGELSIFKNNISCEFERNYNKGNRSVFQCKKLFSGPVYKLIHKSIIGSNRFNINFKNGEDSLFMFQISKNFKNVSLTSKECIYFRRLRNNSATSSKKTLKYRFKLLCGAICEYCIIFIKSPTKFNLLFFLSRILGAVKTFIISN